MVNLLELVAGCKVLNWLVFSSELGVSSSLKCSSSISSTFAWNLIEIEGTEVVTGLPKMAPNVNVVLFITVMNQKHK